MTNVEAANEYLECAVELAECIDKINSIRERCQAISEKTNDNGDPDFMLSEALVKIAPALAVIVTYQDEYRKEKEER